MKTNRLMILATRLTFLALLAVTTVLVLSCERSPLDVAATTGAPPQVKVFGTSLLTCTPLTPDSESQAIGPLGGTIQVGPHSFTVPAGALDSTVTITAVMPADTINRVVFEPTGLVFNQPASLTMSYANCSGLGLLPIPRVIVQVDDSLNILGLLKSVSNPPSQTVTAQVPHFSDYAVAW